MKYSVVMLCLFRIFLSCKKEKKDPLLPNASNGNEASDSVRGVFSVGKFYLLDNDSLVAPENRTSVIFYKDNGMSPDSIPPKTVYVGNVFLNGVHFRADSGSFYYTYFDTTSTTFSSPYHWHIVGANGYPGLNVTQVMDFPVYHNASTIPDTLTIGQQQLITIGNYSGTSVTMVIDSYDGSWGYIEKKITYPNSHFTILPQDYATKEITEGPGYISLVVSNVSYQTIYGKPYTFSTSVAIFKPVYLKGP